MWRERRDWSQANLGEAVIQPALSRSAGMELSQSLAAWIGTGRWWCSAMAGIRSWQFGLPG